MESPESAAEQASETHKQAKPQAPDKSRQAEKPVVALYLADFMPFIGIERYLIELAKGLLENGHFQTVLVGSPNSHFAKWAAQEQLPYIAVPVPKGLRKPFWRLAYLPALFALVKALDENHVSIVHVQGGRFENILFHALGFKLVYTFHGYALHLNTEHASLLSRLKAAISNPLFSCSVPFIDKLIFVSHSEYNRAKHAELLPQRADNTAVIHNGLDVHAVHARALQAPVVEYRQRLGIRKDSRCVTWVNNFDANKDPLKFVKIAETLAMEDAFGDVQFIIAGDGLPKADALRAAIETSRAKHRIHYLGFRTDIPELMAMSDVVVNVAELEAFGLMVLEAMACNTVPLVYEAGGMVELLPPEDFGELLAPRGDLQQLMQRLRKILAWKSDKRQQVLEALWQQAQHFDHKTMVEQVETVYARVLQ